MKWTPSSLLASTLDLLSEHLDEAWLGRLAASLGASTSSAAAAATPGGELEGGGAPPLITGGGVKRGGGAGEGGEGGGAAPTAKAARPAAAAAAATTAGKQAAGRLAYHVNTDLKTGLIDTAINTLADPIAKIVSTKALNVADGFITSPAFLPNVLNADKSILYGACIKFICRCDSYNPSAPDMTEANRLLAEINSFVTQGYSIVISDGSWFLDMGSFTPYNGNLAAVPLIASAGAAYGVGSHNGAASTNPNYAYVWFNLNDSNSMQLYPIDGLDGAQVSIYAVPSSVAVSAGQYIIEGFASNDQTKTAKLVTNYDGILTTKPGSSTPDGFVSCEALKSKFAFKRPLFATPAFGAFEIYAASTLGPGATGNIDDVVADPSIGWNGGSDPVALDMVYCTGSGGSDPSHAWARIKLYLMMSDYLASFFCVESSFEITAQKNDHTSATLGIYYQAAFESAVRYVFPTANIGIARLANIALRERIYPIWASKKDSLKDFVDMDAPTISIDNPLNHPTDVTYALREIFVWAFTKFGFASIYSTVYPFWTQGTCAKIATDGATGLLVSVQGFGTVAADGSQSWTPFTLPANASGAINVVGSAWNAHQTGLYPTIWCSVGWIQPTTGSKVITSWTYLSTGWYANTVATGGANPTRIRYVGTKFVATFDDGTIRTSTDGITWSGAIQVSPWGAGSIYDIAFDGMNYIAVGPSGHIYKSTNLTSWTDVTASGITGIVYGIAWLASGSGGAIYVACGAGGKAYYANQTQALAGTWTAVALGSSGDSIDAIGVTATGSNAILSGQTTTGFRIWSTGDGVSYGVAFSDTDDSMGGVNGYGSGVVYTSNGWVVGTESGNIITSIHGGQPVPSTWIPWGTSNPKQALANLRGRYFGGIRKLVYGGTPAIQNPVQWTGGKFYVNLQTWGIAFDPPTSTVNDYSGTNADAAARKIAAEWWAFAGEMSSTVLDGSNDSIDETFPELALGNIEDVATIITVQYQPFGGKYLGSAYIQNVNVDRATAGKPDAFFFAGWDSTGNTNGLALWTLCRNVFLKTGILRATSLTFDSIHDPDTLGLLWTTVDPDLGTRMRWLCDRPRYLKLIINGNDSKAAQAQCGCRYKPNTAMLDGRQMPALNSTGYGVVVQADHNYTQGTHTLDIAFPPA